MGKLSRYLARAKDNLDQAGESAKRFVRDGWWSPVTRLVHLGSDGAAINIRRQRERSGSFLDQWVRMGPNHVHAFITHPDGTVKDIGVSKNLMTNIGVMVLIGMGGQIASPAAAGTPASNSSATSITVTGTPLTASNLGTPTLGLAGMRIYAPITNVTTTPVYGNIVSNTTSVITVDKWWNSDDTTGTTPSTTCAFVVSPGGIAAVRFMGLTTNSSAAAATNTTLASEITTNGGSRALATFARGANPSSGSGTFTLQKAFSITGTLTAIHRMGLFGCLTAAGADPLIFETVLNQDATVGNGDTLTVTDTVTLSG